MAGHSQNRARFHYGTCPSCEKKGLGKEKVYAGPLEVVHYKECRYCGFMKVIARDGKLCGEEKQDG